MYMPFIACVGDAGVEWQWLQQNLGCTVANITGAICLYLGARAIVDGFEISCDSWQTSLSPAVLVKITEMTMLGSLISSVIIFQQAPPRLGDFTD